MHYGKQEIYRLLTEQHIPFRSLEHPAVYTVEEMKRLGIAEEKALCKNLFLQTANGKHLFLVTIPGTKRADLKALAAQLGTSRLSFASAERLMACLGVTQGSVSPFGLLNDQECQVTMVFDRELQERKEVKVHPNDNTASVWLSFEDLCGLIRAHGNPILFAELAPGK